VTNHEYVEPRYLHGAYAGRELDANEVLYSDDGRRDDDEVLKEMNAHGVSVTRVSAKGDGGWDIVADPGNRRVTGLTEMEISGPVRGCKHVRTRFSPDGTRSRGTLNNCASGATPWNTYLAAEENWAGYFRNDDDALPREHARYGVVHGKPSRYGWETAARGADETARFDASTKGDAADADYRNEPNSFGWMVEIDPFNPE